MRKTVSLWEVADLLSSLFSFFHTLEAESNKHVISQMQCWVGILSLLNNCMVVINQEKADEKVSYSAQKLTNSRLFFFFFLCSFCLLLKPNLSDQIGTGVLVIGLIEIFLRDV